MNILLLIDTIPEINREKLNTFLSSNCKFIKFTIYEKPFSIDHNVISKPDSFNRIYGSYGKEFEGFDRVFCFTDLPYNDNYFFHKHNKLLIFSFASWGLLTNLPKTNGLIYFIVDCLSKAIDTTKFRHYEITGCIYDFLRDKKGIDAGMRQARLCLTCLKRVTDLIADVNTQRIFEDIKILMDLLSLSSKWDRDIFEDVKINSTTINKRSPRSDSVITSVINVVIASPDDTYQERQLLLDKLEILFRKNSHERHCGFRIIVSGWEDLASQPGYPQDIINKKIIDESDFVISIFKHKLGTPTIDQQTGEQRAESGTAEELLQALDNSNATRPIAMSYFYSKAPEISLESSDFEKKKLEWERLKEFKKTIAKKMIYQSYSEPTELLNKILNDLEKNIGNYIIKKPIQEII
ncbi:MAG: hypothetical protein LBC59_05030 [Chitinispirillales bacterium]|jgi:hypothetical protein|nr:hypothetical protein [Chitinispirillales bacterium]